MVKIPVYYSKKLCITFNNRLETQIEDKQTSWVFDFHRFSLTKQYENTAASLAANLISSWVLRRKMLSALCTKRLNPD